MAVAPQLNYFGSELKEKFGNGWSISNNFLFDGGYVHTHALVNNGNPADAVVLHRDSDRCLPALTPADVQATYANGHAVSPNQSVITEQVWYVQKKITNVTDEFRLNKDFGNGNTLTFGVYAAHYTDERQLVVQLQRADRPIMPNASPIILSATAGGNIYHVTSPQGIVNSNGGYYILQNGNATNVALYLSDSWKIDQLVVRCLGLVSNIST